MEDEINRFERPYRQFLALPPESQTGSINALENVITQIEGGSIEVDSQIEGLRKDILRREVIQRIREVVDTSLPSNAKVIVVSTGDSDLLNLGGRQAWHFPQTEDGVYAGYYPAERTEAIAHLEALRTKRRYLLFLPSTALWWLEHYAEFKQHLESHHRLLVRQEDRCLIFALHRLKLDQSCAVVQGSGGRAVFWLKHSGMMVERMNKREQSCV